MRNSRNEFASAPKSVRHVHLYGSGHLAAATRLELVRLGIHREMEYQLPPLLPPLIIACSDSENDASLVRISRRALNHLSPMLFACLADRVVRIGPLIEPRAPCLPRTQPPREARDIPPIAAIQASAPGSPALGVADADPRIGLYARLGAVLVATQALNFLQGARTQCVVDTVIELDPLSVQSRAYRVLKVRQ